MNLDNISVILDNLHEYNLLFDKRLDEVHTLLKFHKKAIDLLNSSESKNQERIAELEKKLESASNTGKTVWIVYAPNHVGGFIPAVFTKFDNALAYRDAYCRNYPEMYFCLDIIEGVLG